MMATRPRLLLWVSRILVGALAAMAVGLASIVLAKGAAGVGLEAVSQGLMVLFVAAIVVLLLAVVVGLAAAPWVRCPDCDLALLLKWSAPVKPQPRSSFGFGGAVAVAVNVLKSGQCTCPHCGRRIDLP